MKKYVGKSNAKTKKKYAPPVILDVYGERISGGGTTGGGSTGGVSCYPGTSYGSSGSGGETTGGGSCYPGSSYGSSGEGTCLSGAAYGLGGILAG